jgi:hypothetical protein
MTSAVAWLSLFKRSHDFMAYWKFLRAGAISPFTGHVWVRDEWGTVRESRICHSGFHACRVADLPYWLNEELWQIELAPPVSQAEHKVVATRAMAVSKVESWTSEMAVELALACARRTAGHASAELADHGLSDAAGHLADVASSSPPTAWIDVTKDCAQAAVGRGARQASKLCAYVLDAIEALEVYPVGSSAYIAARAANQRSSADSEDPYAAEREWQARWLAKRLGLDATNP